MTEEDSAAGKQLGDFRILREIGRGGMGTVYLAEQISLRRTVALKVLNPGVSLNPNVIRRFQREAEAAGRLHHPYIVQVFSVGEEQNTYFFAMEYIDGESLDQIARRMRKGTKIADLSTHPSAWSSQWLESDKEEEKDSAEKEQKEKEDEEEQEKREGESTDSTASESQEYVLGAARLMAEIADALDYAHRHGIIHRDVKPHNILVDRSGRPYLVDFGLAQAEGSMGITKTGEVFGTPTYMSPEQVAGSLAKLDHRTDIYSLGCSFYELLTLRRPFEGKTPQEIVRKILTTEPKDPRRLNPSIPKDLSTIVLKSIEKDPDKRYRTAAELEADLKRFLAGEPILARPIGFIEHGYRYIARRRGATAAISAIALLVLILMYVGGKSSNASRNMQSKVAANQAQTFYREGKIEEAEKLILEGLEKDSTNPELYLLRGQILRGQARLDDAKVAFAEAARLDPKNPLPRVESGNIFKDQKDWEKAAKFYRDALSLNDKAPEVHDSLGTCLNEIGDRQGSTQHYEKAEKLRRESAMPFVEEARHLYADALQVLSQDPLQAEKKLLQAESKCVAALEKYPSLEDAHIERAVIYIRMSRFPEALKDLDLAIETDRANPEPYFYRAEVQVFLKSSEAAKKDFEGAVRLAERKKDGILVARAHSRLAQMDVDSGNWNSALIHLDAAFQQNPKNSQTIALRAIVFAQLGRLEESESGFRQLVELKNADSVTGYLGQALLHERQGNWSSALYALEQADKNFPNQPPLLYHRARIGLAHRKDPLDRAALEKAIGLVPESAEFYLLRFRARLSEKGAEEDFLFALDLDPEFTVQNFFESYAPNSDGVSSVKSLCSLVAGTEFTLLSGVYKSSVTPESEEKFLSPTWRNETSSGSTTQVAMTEIERLIGDLRSPAARARENAAKGLMECGWSAISVLRAAREIPESESEASAILEKIEKRGGEAKYHCVLRWLKESEKSRKKRFRDVGTDAVPALIQVLSNETDRNTKRLAFVTLVDVSASETEAGLLPLLDHSEPIVRFYALRSLSVLKKLPPPEKLRELFRDKAASVRLAALLTLNRQTATEGYRSILSEELQDSMPLLRWMAARLIGDREERSMMSPLRRALQNEAHSEVRDQMFRSLFQIGDEAATIAFGISNSLEQRKPTSSLLSDMLFKSLFQSNSVESVPLELEQTIPNRVLQDKNPLTTLHYVRLWGIERNPGALKILFELRSSSSSLERAAALWALVRLGLEEPANVQKIATQSSKEGDLLRSLIADGDLSAPESSTLMSAIARRLYELERYEELQNFAEKAQQQFPQQSSWILYRFQAFQNRNDWPHAKERIEEALQLFPNEKLVLYRAANFFLMKHDKKDPRRALDLGMQYVAQENSGWGQLILAQAYEDLGRYDEAKLAVDEGLKLSKNLPVNREQLETSLDAIKKRLSGKSRVQ